jgi:hypothetical protein
MNFKETPECLKSISAPEVAHAWHATHALKKFCETHNCATQFYLEKFDTMLDKLEEVNFDEAVAIGATIPTGGLNGCFDDVWLEPISEMEDEASAHTTFRALVAYWRTAIGNPPWPK